MKMKKLVAGLLSAAMVFTSVSYNGYGVNQAEAAATTAGTEVDVLVDYTQVNNDLKTNARANSQQSGTTGDGDASCAFDGNRSNWWHSNYGQNNAYQLAAYNTTTDAKIKDANQAGKKIWIETMFNSPQTVYGLKYTSRGGTENNQIREYEVWVSTEDKHSVDINTEATTANGWTLAQSGTFYQTGANNEQTVRFDTPAQNVKSIRLVAKNVYTVQTGTNANGYVAANELKFCTQLNKVNKNLNNYGEFWDAETGAGTLSVQKAEDRWQFEVKVGGQWKNYLTSGDKRTNGVFFESGWRTNSNDIISRDGFRQKIGDNFAANAFAWVAPEAGYYKFKQHGNMGSSLRISGNMDLQLVKANATSADGTDLNGNENHNNGRAFESKIQKMSKGDRFRFVSTKGNGVNNYCDGDQKTWEVIPCTAKEYAAQWGPTVTVDETKPQALQSDVTELKTTLQNLVETSTSEAKIKEGIKALEDAIARMNNYTAMESVTFTNGGTHTLKVDEKLNLTVNVLPAAYPEVKWTVTGATGVVSQDNANKNQFTAVAPGTVTIKATSVYDETKFAETTVIVKNDTAALELAIAKANGLLIAGNYTQTSLDNLKTAIEAAEGVRDDATATAKAIEDAVKALEEVMSSLVRTYTVKALYADNTEVATAQTGEYNKVVTFTAPEMKDNQKFVCWTYDGKTFSTQRVLKVAITNDATYVATYATVEQQVTPEVLMLNKFVEKRTDGKANVFFIGQIVIPEGAEVLEAGAIWRAKKVTNLSDLVSDEQNGTLAPKAKKITVTSLNCNKQFRTIVKGMPKGATATAVMFAKVKIGNEVKYVYSDVHSVTY